ncbi:MAG: hypothetical protein KIT54_02235 [Phycisphaeraceae bacterium]|nr:hypothetical protein [Phycisphaeraceae bacterium]
MALLDNNAKVYERVWYTPYGQARHHWGQDIKAIMAHAFLSDTSILHRATPIV